MKVCIKCGVEKAEDAFYKNSGRRDRLSVYCRECTKAFVKKYVRSDKYKEYRNSAKHKRYEKAHNKRRAKFDKRKEDQKRYLNRRLATDVLFRQRRRMRTLIWVKLNSQGYTKRSQTHEILGADFETVMAHLGPKPEGKVHIDHITPCAISRNEEELIKLQHYTNLRWMPAKKNLSKSDKWTPEGAALCLKLLGREWRNE